MNEFTSIANTTKGKPPRLLFSRIDEMRRRILGKKYELSIAYVSARESQKWNKKLRKRDRPTNILSFPLGPLSGELIIHLPLVKRQAPEFGLSEQKFLVYLLIHGMLHLKGHVHGGTMEKEEARWCRSFGVKRQ